MHVKLISITQPVGDYISILPSELQTPEGLIAYTARVSSPHQDNPDYVKLISYLIKHKHWSPFEMVDMTVEIVTSRAIAAQILRHRSFVFQEFSQRYAEVTDFELYEARRQDTKNRQHSIDDLSSDIKARFIEQQKAVQSLAYALYREALANGVAKEQARFLLPLSTQTRLYMKGNLRSWIHYIELRGLTPGTQKEHKEIAIEAHYIFCRNFPIITQALGWRINNA